MNTRNRWIGRVTPTIVFMVGLAYILGGASALGAHALWVRSEIRE